MTVTPGLAAIERAALTEPADLPDLPLVTDQALHDLFAETGIEPTWIVTPAALGLSIENTITAIRDGSVLTWPATRDGRTLLVDAGLNLVGVTPGVIDSAALWAYLRGQCLALAATIATAIMITSRNPRKNIAPKSTSSAIVTTICPCRKSGTSPHSGL